MIPAALLAISLLWNSDDPSDRAIKSDLRCGSYCLYVSLKALDVPNAPTLNALESVLGQPGAYGYSMGQLAEAARHFGAYAEGVTTSLDALRERTGRFSCIAHMDRPGHFVAINAIGDEGVSVIDPPRSYPVDAEAFNLIWDRQALLISDQPIPLGNGRPRYWLAAVTFVTVVVLGLAATGALRKWGRGRRLANLVLLMGIPAIGSGCGRGEADGAQAGVPRGEAVRTVIALGTVEAEPARVIATEVEIRNRGTATLHLISMASSCGCTIPDRPLEDVPPGQSLVIPVGVKPGTEPGPRSSTVTIRTDDPVTPVHEIAFRWAVVTPLMIEPHTIDFGRVETGKVEGRSVLVRLESGPGREPLRVTSGESSLAWEWGGPSEASVAGSVSTTTRPLKVKLHPGEADGTGAAMLVVTTADGRHKADLALTWEVGRDLIVSPDAFFEAKAVANADFTARVVVRSEGGRPFRIRDVSRDGRPQLGGYDRDSASSSHALSLVAKVPAKPGIHRTRFTIATDAAGSPVLSVPVSFVVP